MKEKCPETYTCHRVKTIEMKRLHSLSLHAAEEKRIMMFPLVFKRALRRRIRLERICGTEEVQDLCVKAQTQRKGDFKVNAKVGG